jgi:hypothetical protein
MQSKELIDVDLKINIDNAKTIASIFQELSPKYKQNCECISERLSSTVSEINELLKENEFNKLSQRINLVFKSYELLSEHLDEDEYKKIKKSITDSVLDHLKNNAEQVNQITCKERLDDSDIEFIENILKIIDEARENLASGKLFKKNDLNEQKEIFLLKLTNYFDKLDNKIKELFNENSNDSFKEMGSLIEQMKKIRKIPIIEIQTSESFHKTIQNIIGEMNRVRRDAEDLLKRFIDNREDVDYEKIAKYLDYLKNAEWINGHKQGAYDNIIKNIREEIIKNSTKLQEFIMNTEIDLENHKN